MACNARKENSVRTTQFEGRARENTSLESCLGQDSNEVLKKSRMAQPLLAVGPFVILKCTPAHSL
jgi:hypothetical protein